MLLTWEPMCGTWWKGVVGGAQSIHYQYYDDIVYMERCHGSCDGILLFVGPTWRPTNSLDQPTHPLCSSNLIVQCSLRIACPKLQTCGLPQAVALCSTLEAKTLTVAFQVSALLELITLLV
eukprot:3934452-Rhodomonas_salina.1